MKPLILDLPYPSAADLTTDVRSGNIISFGYATLKGEISAVLQYVYHRFYFGIINKEDADALMSIALAEMRHIDILGEAMLRLGVSPRYVQCPNTYAYYNTSQVSKATSPAKMLMDDVESEMNAIADYQKMLFALKNEQVAAIIQRIILDEQLHLDTFKKLLEKYSDKNNGKNS